MKKLGSIAALFLLILNAEGQNTNDHTYVLSGTVVNGDNNLPLIGANIVTSTNLGTKTNDLGEFTIKVELNDTLTISFVGFKSYKYIASAKQTGKYLIKFRLYKDSVTLSEVEIFPWPTYDEFKDAFLEMNKEDEKISINGVKTYRDRSIEPCKPTIFNPASFIYDKLFDKQAKLKRRLARNRELIKESLQIEN